MANGSLNGDEAVGMRGSWPAFFHEQLLANVQFWLNRIAAQEGSAALLHQERDGVQKALGRALQSEAAGYAAVDLLLAFHPYVERQGAWGDWERFLEAGLLFTRRKGDTAREAALLDRLGDLKRDRGEWAVALEHHELAYRLGGEAGQDAVCARAATNVGHACRLLRRFSEAEEALHQALELYAACHDQSGLAFAYTNLGLLLFEQRRFDEALAHHQTAYELWCKAENLAGMGQAQHNMGNVYNVLGSSERAEECFHSALEWYERAHSRLFAAVTSMDLGNVYLRQGRSDEAETFYRRAEAAMQEMAYSHGLAQVLNNLGMALSQQKQWTLAEDCLRRSILLWRQLTQPIGEANALDNLAEVFLQQHMWQEARSALQRALSLLRGLQPEARVTALLADVDQHLRMTDAGPTTDPDES